MTVRERFHAVMSFQPFDRLPLADADGYERVLPHLYPWPVVDRGRCEHDPHRWSSGSKVFSCSSSSSCSPPLLRGPARPPKIEHEDENEHEHD